MLNNQPLKIRSANRNDSALILEFIKELAIFEKLEKEVVATEELISEQLFGDQPKAEVIIAEWQGTPAGFALFFHNFSTFLARPGIYLEDLFVKPDMRGKSIGKSLLGYLAKLCVQRNCGRFEWAVLDWNKKAIAVYERIGAKPQSEWIGYRMTGKAIKELAQQAPQ